MAAFSIPTTFLKITQSAVILNTFGMSFLDNFSLKNKLGTKNQRASAT